VIFLHGKINDISSKCKAYKHYLIDAIDMKIINFFQYHGHKQRGEREYFHICKYPSIFVYNVEHKCQRYNTLLLCSVQITMLSMFSIILLFICVLENTQSVVRPVVIGHRGTAYLPELTLATQSMAHAYGADIIEIDVCLSRDNQLIVIHGKSSGY
jgi:hypothetical protein